MIQVLDPREWIIQIKSVPHKSRKVVSICGNLGAILKSETPQVFLKGKSFSHAKEKLVFYLIRRLTL